MIYRLNMRSSTKRSSLYGLKAARDSGARRSFSRIPVDAEITRDTVSASRNIHTALVPFLLFVETSTEI